jgi:hypothetical protein
MRSHLILKKTGEVTETGYIPHIYDSVIFGFSADQLKILLFYRSFPPRSQLSVLLIESFFKRRALRGKPRRGLRDFS